MKKGFTLIELLIVIVLLGLLGGLAMYSYQSFLSKGKSKYYDTLENSILLAGGDYFSNHREMLPIDNNVLSVSIKDLVDEKYLEPVIDSRGNVCESGLVYVYRDNNKYNYEVCLKCGNEYESVGKYCQGGYSSKIEISSKLVSGHDYIVTNSYISTAYSKNENVLVTFKMDSVHYEPKKYVVIDTKTNTIKTECNVLENATCTVEIDESGTYQVMAYDKDNEMISSKQQFNVRISKNAPIFTISGENRFEIDKFECSDNKTTKDVKFQIVKNNINEEYKSIKYCIKRLENNDDCAEYNDYQNSNDLFINANLESGAYILEVIITNFVDEESTVQHNFDIMYDVDLEYDDDYSTGIHKVVKGQNYNYLSTKYSDIKPLPTHKKAYDIDNHEIRWHLASEEYDEDKRITGESMVSNNCTYKLIGLMSIPVDIPNDWTVYCANPTYNGNSQSLTKTLNNVTFINKDQINAGEYTIEAKINSPRYIWKGTWDFANKTFKCSMQRAGVTFPTCASKVYNGKEQTLFAARTSSSNAGYTNNAIKGTKVNTYKQTLTLDSNHKWRDTNGTTARSLSCEITRKDITSQCPSSPSDKEYNGKSQKSGITCPDGSTASGTQSATEIGEYTQKCVADSNHIFTKACSVKWKITYGTAEITCTNNEHDWTPWPNTSARAVCECSHCKITNSLLNTSDGRTFAAYSAGPYNCEAKADTNYRFSNGSSTSSKTCRLY